MSRAADTIAARLTSSIDRNDLRATPRKQCRELRDRFCAAAVYPDVNRRVVLNATLLLVVLSGPGCDVVDRVLRRIAEASGTEASSAAATSKVTPLTVTEVAYAAGRRWGESCVFAMTGKSEAADFAHLQAVVGSLRAGLEEPQKASKANSMDLLVHIDLPEGKGGTIPDVAIAYALGATVTQGVFAGAMDADLKRTLDAIDVYAARVPVPGAVWKPAVEALRGGVSAEKAAALGEAFDRYFRYDRTKTGPAWNTTDAPAPAIAPFAHTSSDGRYSVTFPFEPEEVTRTRNGVEWHETGTSIETYMVSYADYPDAARAEKAMATVLGNMNSEGIDNVEVTFAGQKARAATYVVGESKLLIRAFVVDRRFYKVGASSKAEPARAQRFLDSFALTGQ